ncbi:MAG TPA: nuclear transport factor 2 family protein [Bryobacteraceae bacterium]|nr:nuclear transport factor 2 family protein [Bryobacteraceae bacterium]
MPQDNADRVRAMYEAFARGDVPSVLAGMDAQIEWNEAENFVYADQNPYIGPQAILAGVFMRIGGDWDSFAAAPEEILPSGDTVISLGRYRGTYKATGKRVDAQFVHVFKFRDGKIVKFQQYTDTAQFRDALGRGAAAKAN